MSTNRYLFVLLVLVVLFTSALKAYAPGTDEGYIDGEYAFVTDPRTELPCRSPKYLPRETKVNEAQTLGARWAPGCQPANAKAPAMSCPAGTVALFSVPGKLEVGTLLPAGGKITALKGEWEVIDHQGMMMAKEGRTITITFDEPIHVDSALIFDNDPKNGANGWSLDNVPLPTTPRRSWGALVQLNTLQKQLVFDNGQDSPHFNICVWAPK